MRQNPFLPTKTWKKFDCEVLCEILSLECLDLIFATVALVALVKIVHQPLPGNHIDTLLARPFVKHLGLRRQTIHFKIDIWHSLYRRPLF